MNQHFMSILLNIQWVLTKTRNDLKRIETIYNEQTPPETTYNKQETTWNDLKQPTVSKKRLIFPIIFQSISDVFDLILFMGVVLNSSSESSQDSASMVACRNVMKTGSVWLSVSLIVI